MRRIAFLVVAALLCGPAAAVAQEKKPRVPPGRDPGGTAIALFSMGVDYTLPAVAARLARDGEGEPIAWDLLDNDRYPFDRDKGGAPASWGGDATALAALLAGDGAGARLVVVRVGPGNAASLARAVAFVAQTPARVAVVPMWSANREEWEPFAQAAARHPNVLFIAGAGDGPDASVLFPVALGLDNVLAVATEAAGIQGPGFGGIQRTVAGGPLAAVLAAKSATDILAREPALAVPELKRRIIAKQAAPK